MTATSLIRKGLSFYAENGLIRTIGAVARFCGSEIDARCRWLQHVHEWDSRKGYPLAVRARAARHGLSAHSYLWMGLGESDVESYLRSEDPITALNRGHIEPIDNNVTFQLLTEPYVDALPTLYGRLEDGVFVD